MLLVKNSPLKLDEVKVELASDDNEMDNKVYSYYPIVPNKGSDLIDLNSAKSSNKIKPNSGYTELERENNNNQRNAPKQVLASSLGEQLDSSNIEKMKSIAFNSREVRLVGPDQREVEMKDDVATKVQVAIENFQKEATEVLGQVNEKLDKGWTELKTMVEKADLPTKIDKGWTDFKSMVENVVSPSKAGRKNN